MEKKPNAQSSLEYLMTYGWAIVMMASIASVLFFVFQQPTGQMKLNLSLAGQQQIQLRSTSTNSIQLQNLSPRQLLIEGVRFYGSIYPKESFSINGQLGFPTNLQINAGGTINLDGIDSQENCKDGGSIIIDYTESGEKKEFSINCNGGAKLPIAHYSFDEIGNLGNDNGSAKNNCAVNGSPAIETDCPKGNCANFNGSSDYLDCGNNQALQLTGDLTILFWAKPLNLGSSRRNPFCKSYGAEYCITSEKNGSLSYYHGPAGDNKNPYFSFSSPNIFETNEWEQISIVRNSSQRKVSIFKNGVYASSATWAQNRDPSTSTGLNVMIANGYAGKFNGMLDEIQIYDKVLTDSEVCSNFKQFAVAAGLAPEC